MGANQCGIRHGDPVQLHRGQRGYPIIHQIAAFEGEGNRVAGNLGGWQYC